MRSEKTKRKKWDGYPYVPPEIKSEKREIKSIRDISVGLSGKADWNNYPLIEERTDMGNTNGNAVDIEIAEYGGKENGKQEMEL